MVAKPFWNKLQENRLKLCDFSKTHIFSIFKIKKFYSKPLDSPHFMQTTPHISFTFSLNSFRSVFPFWHLNYIMLCHMYVLFFMFLYAFSCFWSSIIAKCLLKRARTERAKVSCWKKNIFSCFCLRIANLLFLELFKILFLWPYWSSMERGKGRWKKTWKHFQYKRAMSVF